MRFEIATARPAKRANPAIPMHMFSRISGISGPLTAEIRMNANAV